MRVYKTLFAVALLALLLDARDARAQVRRFPADPGTPRRPTAAQAESDTPDVRSLLGITVGTSGTDRDTLGLLVTQVLRDGPGDRAGIDEGNRLAEIDGVSLRVDAADIGRSTATDAVMRRMTRTLRVLREGEQATLRLFGGGRFRNVTVQLGAAANGAISVSPVPPAPRSAPIAVAGEPASRATSVTAAMQSLAELQTQLRRLADDEGTSPFADSLAQAARELGLLQRRLRAAQAEPRRRGEDVSERGASRRGNTDVPGLSLSPVSDDLSDYFGDGSERGLLVLQAESSWSPIRNGDVILTVDAAPVTADRLRQALDSRQPVRIEILRRRRQMSVTLNGRE